MPRITSSPTPNPNSLKFTLDDGTFIESGMESFDSPASAAGHALGSRLFEIEGITNVFILPEFLTVTKEAAAGWNEIIAEVESAVDDYISAS